MSLSLAAEQPLFDLSKLFSFGSRPDNQTERASSQQHGVIDVYLQLLQDRSFQKEFTPGMTVGFFNLVKDSYHKLKRCFFPSLETPRFESWNAHTYLELLTNPTYRDAKVLTSLLSQNFDAFSAEYTRGELLWEREYIFGEDGAIIGMAEAYQDDLSADRHGNFSRVLAEQQRSTVRADHEDKNLVGLKEWICTVPLHSIFVWSSPPGLIAEGYTGTESHSFTFVYHKTDRRRAKVSQYRTWMPLYQHAALQTALDKKPASAAPDVSHRIILNTLSLIAPNENPEVWAQTMLGNIQTMLYTNTNAWRVKPEEMPDIDEEKFTKMRDFLFSLYIRKVVPLLLTKVPHFESLTDPKWIAFKKTADYKKIIKELDVAFGVFAYQPLGRFVEQSSTKKKPTR